MDPQQNPTPPDSGQPPAGTQPAAPPPPVPATGPVVSSPDPQAAPAPQPGVPVVQVPQPGYPAQPGMPGNPQYAVPVVHVQDHHGTSGMAIASLVLGILAAVLFWAWFLAIPLGILALVFGLIAHKKGGGGMALAGTILGGIGMLAAILLIIWAVWIVNKAANSLDKVNSDTNSGTVQVQSN